MKCPICGFEDTKVVDSRPTGDDSIRRRRECLSCRFRFTTYEYIEAGPIFVIKKDGSREIFDRNKIMTGLVKACYKRPVSNAQLDNIISEIESSVANSMRREISSSEIGSMVMDSLRQLAEVSSVGFASVYRESKDVDTFLKELKELKNSKLNPEKMNT